MNTQTSDLETIEYFLSRHLRKGGMTPEAYAKSCGVSEGVIYYLMGTRTIRPPSKEDGRKACAPVHEGLRGGSRTKFGVSVSAVFPHERKETEQVPALTMRETR